MFFDILTIFPGMCEGVIDQSIVSRARKKGIAHITLRDIRHYTDDRHRSVDDYPYGGDAGMLFTPPPLARALDAARQAHQQTSVRTLFFSPAGRRLTHRVVEEYCREPGVIIICGHYKGIDQRIRARYVDDEISLGDFVLSGGELPAMVFVDAVVRLLPGVLGNSDSAKGDSFFNGILGPPHYTRPEVFDGEAVPEVLLSGHHARIREWQEKKALALTRERRPDLWRRYVQKII